MLGAVMFGHRHFQPVIEAIIRLAEKAAKEPRELELPDNAALEKEMLGLVEQDLRAAYAIPRQDGAPEAVEAAKAKVMAHFLPAGGREPALRQAAGRRACSRSLKPRSCAGTSSTPAGASTAATSRPCGRSCPRSACCRAPTARRCSPAARPRRSWWRRSGPARTSNSSTRCEGTYKETFLLHYNFPPFSVGETGRLGSPGRREIGHGKLAWRAIHPMLPLHHEFPYTIRVVSEITESNGSSSMATVCGTSLALMDAGVPLQARRPPASPWASSWRTSASRCCPTSSATRTISATWTSRWPAPSRA